MTLTIRPLEFERRNELRVGSAYGFGWDEGTLGTARQARRRVVDRFVVAVAAFRALATEPLQVARCRRRRHHQGQRAGIRRDHQVLRQSALEPKSRHAERLIVVVRIRSERPKRTFGNAPRHATLSSVGDLSLYRGVATPLQQRAGDILREQRRHQVLEHRAAPRKQPAAV